jgi:hypothetical protein
MTLTTVHDLRLLLALVPADLDHRPLDIAPWGLCCGARLELPHAHDDSGPVCLAFTATSDTVN